MKTFWRGKKWTTVLLHIAAWVFFFSVPYLLRAPNEGREMPHREENPNAGYIFSIVMNTMWCTFFYLNALVFIPAFMYRKKYWKFFSIHLAFFGLALLTQYTLVKILFANGHFDKRNVFFNLLIYLFVFGLSTAYQLIKDKMDSDKLLQEKQNEGLKTELSLLRSQVSPHFMFNVLNNMVSLARKKSELLEPSLIKLSSLMRYMLYEADEEKVPLEKEIEYLQSYIDLQQQRFGKKVQVLVDMNNADGHYQLEPMLLIPFVENAFKHGTGMIEDAKIDIRLTTGDKGLQFGVGNKYNAASQEIKDKTSGIGLANVIRRLNLLYGKNHQLKISKDNDWYQVLLTINLSK